MAYRAIEDYGIIGDTHTVALVSLNGSIDWCCLPRFDAPSVFAAILDDEKGGSFKISLLAKDVSHKQFYWPETNVLVTRFLSADGVGEVIDYMRVGKGDPKRHRCQIVRTVKAVRGTVSFKMTCHPAFNYARDKHTVKLSEKGACFVTDDLALGLAAEVLLERQGNGVVADFSLAEGRSTTFVLRELEPGAGCGTVLSERQAEKLFRETVKYWRDWLAQCTYSGRWREIVHRSALTLKLLTYKPSGAIIAAPTCSFGEKRNRDSRYTWLRDAASALDTLPRIGLTEEARALMQYLFSLCKEAGASGRPLQIMYGIDGRKILTEETLEHFKGYRGSRPVQVGTGAHDQLQLNSYGELLNSIYLCNKRGMPVSYELWRPLRTFVNWVCDNWQHEDEGIWEVCGKQHFVHSKVMCWVAVDRGLRLADRCSFPADRDDWLEVRDQLYEEIMACGWSEKRQAFVQHYESESLDAANLLMPLVFFLSAADPRLLSTLDATLKPPDEGGLVSNSLVYRYSLSESADGLTGEEGTFNACTFWLVEALTRAGEVEPHRLKQARLMFEQMLGYANHLGLYGEETGHHSEALGNFPQASTHLALISAAYHLDQALK